MSDQPDIPEKKPRKSVTHKLMDYLARRDHSERELRQKLSENYPAGEIDRAIQYAKDNHWLADPGELSERVAGQLHDKGKGFLYISQYLQKKGLPQVDKDAELEYKKALTLIEPERRAGAEIDRMIRKMVNRGFDAETVSRVLNQDLK